MAPDAGGCQAKYPDFTLTDMYNVLEKLRENQEGRDRAGASSLKASKRTPFSVMQLAVERFLEEVNLESLSRSDAGFYLMQERWL